MNPTTISLTLLSLSPFILASPMPLPADPPPTSPAPPTTKPKTSTTTYHQLKLPDPQNWNAGKSLFPGRVMAGYHEDYEKFTKDSWSKYMLQKCQESEGCGSADAYSAINSGTPKVRVWFGYTYSGGATTEKDFVRGPGVEDSVVWTMDS
ncbi:hypothetical protein HII31_12932 [Pseudocercospora fuligena]|uniref:Uncharacterized protein n=1 Tax=Pseudocercospora fuligena TaxID=685502 RepID=A0A8H6R4D6_9PEZI|nr:hypothetical protein HII31_12932 [Pseudocercospora fuligena]